MTWTFTNVLIQIVAGIVGGHVAAVIAHEHSFGLVGHSVSGAAGGFLSGFFLQTLALTMVTASGSLNEPTLVETVVIQAFTGAAAGAALTLVVGFLKHSIDQHRSRKS
jgi:uncharacterized membrane protein YeaQ/YmgE (transglycosylase-associated protein family)